jgi:hypothetical protein
MVENKGEAKSFRKVVGRNRMVMLNVFKFVAHRK